jgi:hypothetical protein
VEHVGGTSLEVERVVRLVQHLLALLHQHRMQLGQPRAPSPETIDEELDFLLGADQPLDFTDAC